MGYDLTVKIVILDSDPAFGSSCPDETRTIGPVESQRLAQLGQIESYFRTEPAEIIERAAGAQVLLTNKVPLGDKEFARLPELKLVSVLATGVNIIDLGAARDHDVTVCNVPGYSTSATAQHAFALLLELVNRVGEHSAHTRSGGWMSSQAFSYFLDPTNELEGKTMGVVGLGAIGTRVGKIAQAFGMDVIANTRTQRPDAPFPLVALDRLLQSSDVVSLHCPLTPETQHLINRKSLASMKAGAILINVSRGPVVDEAALAEALSSGHLKGAAVDVLNEEPPRTGSPLLVAPRCLVTPHIAWASVEARRRLLDMSAENIEAFIKGAPQNVVN